ncbi:MAG: YncE family protein [Candidatus Eremiobacteraeota bacterium]|nr:YncE family protein [Candidatus Eremiobacteraeota bacterium]MBV8497972.1 YncE family protein [Candidatus Eremiobacteraeota bacterium]
MYRRGLRRTAALLVAGIALAGSVPRTPCPRIASGKIAATAWPYLPGSSIPLRIDGFGAPYHAAVLGPGSLSPAGVYEIPSRTSPGSALLVAGNVNGLAAANLRIGAPPNAARSFLVVASYDDGLVFHDAGSFSVLGVLATGGTPTDTDVDALGRIAAADTQGSRLTLATLSPWGVARVDGVWLGDEVAIDAATHAVFVTDRDVDGTGALTRVTLDGSVSRVATGATPEGLAVDAARHVVYVANTNEGTVTAVDTRTMRVLRRFAAVPRVFSLALSPGGTLLYAISNQSEGSPFAAPGAAVAIDLRAATPRVVARSPHLAFPLGAALDPATHTLFVTDEQLGKVDVLDASTLHPKHAPIATCNIPWKPLYDEAAARLYVPCAGADAVDVFDTRSLRRAPHAPFPTGGYPLAVAVWHPPA